MDEVRMVRNSYPEPAPPTAREIARAKALLDDPPRRSLPRLRWGLGGLGGLVAVGAAAAVTIALTGGNTPAPPGQVDLDGRGTILAAAENAERQPTGKYWYTNQFSGQSYLMRARTGTYAITGAHDETFAWRGVKPGMGEGYANRDLPARPLTAQDAALWRKAGSPSTFRVWSGDAFHTYTAKATPWRMEGPEVGTIPDGGGKFIGGRGGKTLEELQNLPTDPAALAEMFLTSEVMGDAAGRPRGKGLIEVNPGAQISRVASLLGSPLPPKVRAGLMRALADQPGIHEIGHATDPLGRRGIALASDDYVRTIPVEPGRPKTDQGTYRSRQVIIFDERTGALLSRQDVLTKSGGRYAEMKPGFIIEYTTTRSARWTDTRPTPPAALPFD